MGNWKLDVIISLDRLHYFKTSLALPCTKPNFQSLMHNLTCLGKSNCTDGNLCSYPAPLISRSSISSGPTSSIPLVIGVTLQHPMSAKSSLSFCFHSSPPHTVAFPLHYTPRAICLYAPNTPTTSLTPCYSTSQRERRANSLENRDK